MREMSSDASSFNQNMCAWRKRVPCDKGIFADTKCKSSLFCSDCIFTGDTCTNCVDNMCYRPLKIWIGQNRAPPSNAIANVNLYPQDRRWPISHATFSRHIRGTCTSCDSPTLNAIGLQIISTPAHKYYATWLQ